MVNNIFKNSAFATRFQEDGYLVLPFFCAAEIDKLKTIYDGIHHNEELIFESTSFIEESTFKEAINSQVELVFKTKIEALFHDYKSLGTSFLTKRIGNNTNMPIHQDWTVVDEDKFVSVTCWIPLVDTTFNNGAMQVIDGSHLISKALRGPSLPISFDGINLAPFLKTIPLKAGEAIIFNHALLHASHSNLSDKERVAVTFGLTHKEAQLLMYYSKKDTVEKWEMPDSMFIEYPKIRFAPTIGKLKEELDYKVQKITLQEVQKNRIERRKKQTMVTLFKNTAHQDFFEKNGYLLLPALNPDDISQLINLYGELGIKDEKGYGFHVAMDNADKDLVQKMVTKITDVVLPKVQEYLHETQLFTASFVVKEPNPQGVVPPHQDWSFVENEVDHCSVTCWIPLQDVSMDNGCMGVIKGSNHFFESHRPSPSPQVETPLKKHMFTIFPFLELIEMKAGEALIFNNKTIHASPPNITNETRLAVGLGFTQKEAEIRHYYLKPGTNDTLLKYKITPDFFLKHDNSQLSELYNKGLAIDGIGAPEEMPYVFEDLDVETFTKMIQDSGNSYNAVLVNRMAQLFNYDPSGNKKEEVEEEESVQITAENNEIVASEPFWKVYTPMNVLREIKHRLSNN
jgi:ectoine hydroxylase-related dioxygenase (phytanoyl-CoA dioxygenase family)